MDRDHALVLARAFVVDASLDLIMTNEGTCRVANALADVLVATWNKGVRDAFGVADQWSGDASRAIVRAFPAVFRTDI